GSMALTTPRPKKIPCAPVSTTMSASAARSSAASAQTGCRSVMSASLTAAARLERDELRSNRAAHPYPALRAAEASEARRGSPGRSAAGEAAVDRQRDAGDHRGTVAKQEHDRRGNLIFGRPAAERHLLEEQLPDLRTSPVESRHRRHDDGRVHTVDPDVVFPELQRRHPCDVV